MQRTWHATIIGQLAGAMCHMLLIAHDHMRMNEEMVSTYLYGSASIHNEFGRLRRALQRIC